MSDSESSSPARGYGKHDPYEPVEIMRIFAELDDPGEPMTARQLADRNHRSRQATLKHARELAEDGVLLTKKTGARGRVFYLPPELRDEPSEWRELL